MFSQADYLVHLMRAARRTEARTYQATAISLLAIHVSSKDSFGRFYNATMSTLRNEYSGEMICSRVCVITSDLL